MRLVYALQNKVVTPSQGYDKQTARYHLLLFSLAAPLAAFFSYFGLVRVSGKYNSFMCQLVQ